MDCRCLRHRSCSEAGAGAALDTPRCRCVAHLALGPGRNIAIPSNKSNMIKKFYYLMDREKKYLVAEMSQVRGLMPLLMKPRNKQRWSPEDRLELTIHLHRLKRISPYIAVVALPGGLAMLPILAWWLDRRRGTNRPIATQ
jgi:hypothetical protein